MEVVEFVDPSKRGSSRGDYKKNRKLFMSSKASDVFKEVPSLENGLGKEDPDDLFPDFDSIFRGVEKLIDGSHSTWKEKKKGQQRKAEALGAKAIKKHKVPIDIVKELGKKRKEKEILKREEELAAGTYVKRAKKAKFSRKPEDRELKVSDGKFKGGVLYVKPMGQSGDKSTKKRRK